MSISELRSRAREVVVDFLWRQWTQIGLSGPTPRHVDHWAVDPEALLLMTLRIAGREPRLFEETLDWLGRNGRFVGLQRLRNLTGGDATSRTLANAATAWAGVHNPLLHGWARAGGERGAEPLSIGDWRITHPDPILLEHGLLWPDVTPSGNSVEPELDLPIALAFRLRLFFGVGSRAEVVRVMLTSAETHMPAQRVADLTGFAKRNVHETLAALVDAGPMLVEGRGNEHVYTLHPAGWWDVLDIPTHVAPTFLDWIALLRVTLLLMKWFDDEERTGQSDYLLASRARDLAEVADPFLRRLEIRPPDPRGSPGASFLGAFEGAVDSFLRVLDGESPSFA